MHHPVDIAGLFSDIHSGPTWPATLQLVMVVGVTLATVLVVLAASGVLSALARLLELGATWALKPIDWLTGRRRHLATVAVAIVLLPFVALAQVDGGAPGPTLTPEAQAALWGLGGQLIELLSGGQHLTGLALAAAVVQVLMGATKLPQFDALWGGRTWVRPLLAVVFGIVLCVLGAVVAGAPIGPALLAGVLTGTIATGLRELVVAIFGTTTKDERALGKAVAEMVKDTDTTAAQKVEVAKAALDKALTHPDEASQLKAIADVFNAKAG